MSSSIRFLSFFFTVFLCFNTLLAQNTETIEKSNHCSVIGYAWTIEGHKTNSANKETALRERLAEINAALVKGEGEENFDETKKKLQLEKINIIYKLDGLKIQGTTVGFQKATFSIIFCRKIITTETEQVGYWGISNVLVMRDVTETEEGDFSLFNTYEIQEMAFNDKLTIKMKIDRNAFQVGASKIEPKSIVAEWTLQIQTNRENPEEAKVIITPIQGDDFLSGINHKENNIGLYYDIDMDSVNEKIIKDINKKLFKID